MSAMVASLRFASLSSAGFVETVLNKIEEGPFTKEGIRLIQASETGEAVSADELRSRNPSGSPGTNVDPDA